MLLKERHGIDFNWKKELLRCEILESHSEMMYLSLTIKTANVCYLLKK